MWFHLQLFLSLLAALLAVSAQVIPPIQNSATSVAENLSTAQYYNQNFYSRDESRIRQHSTTFGNNAEGMTDVVTATSNPLPLPAIDPFYTNFPAQLPHFCHIAPYPVYSPVPECTNTFHNVPIASSFSPHYPLSPYYALPSSGYLALQPALSVPHTTGTVADLLLNPAIQLPSVQILDPTLPQPVYPEPPAQTHHSATNTLNSFSAAANPFLPSSGSLTDNTAYLLDVLQAAQPITV
jgi:hypothetical protein